jgi:hypothetical protein
MGSAALVFIVAIGTLAIAWFRSDKNVCCKALFYALMAGLGEVFVLSFALHQQVEFRHLSSLLPLLILMIMAGVNSNVNSPIPSRLKFSKITAAVALGAVWLISDIIQLTSPDYRREDFKSAVTKCLDLKRTYAQSRRNSVVAVATDPIAAAYYGLSVLGTAPCFPLPDACQQDLAEVPWETRSTAQYALFWSDSQIDAWLQRQDHSSSRVVLLISTSRHPTLKNSAWWHFIYAQSGVKTYPQRGFLVCVFP